MKWPKRMSHPAQRAVMKAWKWTWRGSLESQVHTPKKSGKGPDKTPGRLCWHGNPGTQHRCHCCSSSPPRRQWETRGQVVSREESKRDLPGGSQKMASSHHSKRQANPDNEARDYPMRQTLATLPGVNMARIQKKFILAHQPISQSVSQLITFKLWYSIALSQELEN